MDDVSFYIFYQTGGFLVSLLLGQRKRKPQPCGSHSSMTEFVASKAILKKSSLSARKRGRRCIVMQAPEAQVLKNARSNEVLCSDLLRLPLSHPLVEVEGLAEGSKVNPK